MPWTRPTLTELRQSARAFFAARLPGADATLRRSNIGVTADVLAGMANGEYGYLDYLIRQPFADTSDGDYLLRDGAMYGMAPTRSVKAAGSVICTGTDGAPIPNGIELFQDSAQNIYVTQAAGEIAAGTATVPVQAKTGGAAQNLATGAQLQVTFAIAGLDATASVAAPGLSGGLDGESIEAFRKRVLARKAAPPQGGIATDYVAWALTVPGVTRAWTYPLNRGLSTVDLTFVMDGRADIIPLLADVQAVQAAIDARRPVTDDCIVFEPIATSVNFVIDTDADAETQAAIIASVNDMFLAEAVPGGAYDPASQTTLSGGLSFQDHIDPAVAAANGDFAFTITTPNADVAGSSGHILIPGTFTWT